MSGVNIVKKRMKPKGARERGGYHHGNLRSALISAASEMLEREGPEAVSLRAVTLAAGVSRTAPYNHFDSKEALLAAIAERGFQALGEAQRTAATAVRGEARLIEIGRAYVGFALAHPQLYRLMLGVGVADWRRHPTVLAAKQDSFTPVHEALAELLSNPADTGLLRIAAMSAWAEVHGLAMLLLDGSLAADSAAAGGHDRLVQTILEGFVSGVCRGGAFGAGGDRRLR